MKTTKPILALLMTGTVLGAAAFAPALARSGDALGFANVTQDAAPGLRLASKGEGEDDDDDYRRPRRSGHDDDHDDDDDECDDDDDDDDECGTRSPAAKPAGTVAPPANGLFGSGAPPKVQVN